MSHLIAKDGGLCIVGGSLVTDDGGAPCACGETGVVCADLTRPPGVCFRLEFGGIEVNPCEFTVPNGNGDVWVTRYVIGANATFAAHTTNTNTGLDAFGIGPGRVIVQNLTTGQLELITVELTAAVSWRCVGPVVVLDSVVLSTAASDLGFSNIFRWDGEALIGDTVPNQITCPPPDNFFMRFGINGICRVTASVASPFDCLGDGPRGSVAVRCDDPGVRISVDPTEAPDGSYGILYQGEQYQLTSIATDDPPVPVTWQVPICPPPPGEFMVAAKCFPPATVNGPAEIVVRVDPGVGFGQGAVTLVVDLPNPACPDLLGHRCWQILRYRPTMTSHPGPATPGAIHFAGTPCSIPDTYRCRACPVDGDGQEPIPQPGQHRDPAGQTDGDRMLAAMGFDPEDERRKLVNGGDCGCSPQAGFYG